MNVNELSYKQMLELRVTLNNRLQAFEADAKAKLSQGIAVKGFVLKAGRKQRKVINEDGLVQSLARHGMDYSDIYTAKLLGLPALEKALKSRNLDGSEIAVTIAPFIEVSLSPETMVYVGE